MVFKCSDNGFKLRNKIFPCNIEGQGHDVKFGFLTEEQSKLLTLEIDYLRMFAWASRLQKISNATINKKMQAE
jgi:hypothetical protein